MVDELFYQSIATLSDRLAKKEISAIELTKAVIERTRRVESKIQAFNSRDEDDALAQALASDERRAAGDSKGPLDGIPIGLKDLIAVKNQPLTASSKMLADFISPYDATVTEKLKQAGAVLWGRLNMDELRWDHRPKIPQARRLVIRGIFHAFPVGHRGVVQQHSRLVKPLRLLVRIPVVRSDNRRLFVGWWG